MSRRERKPINKSQLDEVKKLRHGDEGKKSKYDVDSDSSDEEYAAQDDNIEDDFIVNDGVDYYDVEDEQKPKPKSAKQKMAAMFTNVGKATSFQKATNSNANDLLDDLMNDFGDADVSISTTTKKPTSGLAAKTARGYSGSMSHDVTSADLNLGTSTSYLAPNATQHDYTVDEVNEVYQPTTTTTTTTTPASKTPTIIRDASASSAVQSDSTAVLMKTDDGDYAHLHLDNITSTTITTTTTIASASQEEEVKTELYVRENSCIMYWYDIYEEFASEGNSTIYLFGKALCPESVAGKTSNISPNQLQTRSCCVIVKNVRRNMYVLPRKYKLENSNDPESVTEDEVTDMDVYKEVIDLLKARGILNTQAKPVEKRYCFSRNLTQAVDDEKAKTDKKNAKGKKKELAEDDDEDDDIDQGIEVSLNADIPLNRRSLLDPFNMVPSQARFLNLRYSSEYAPLPREIQGKTFSHIFGTRASKTELFVLDRNLIGPSWVTVNNATVVSEVSSKVSWCELEMIIDKQDDIEVYKPTPTEPDLPVPFFSVASLSLKTNLVIDKKGGHHHELIMATLRINRTVSIENNTEDQEVAEQYNILRAPVNTTIPVDFKTLSTNVDKTRNFGQIQTAPREEVMLSLLLNKLERWNPDILLGHDLHGSMMDLVVSTAKRCNIGLQWSKLGRLRKKRIPNVLGGSRSLVDYGAGAGRLMLDTLTSCKEFQPSKNYAMNYLAQELLGSKPLKEVDSRSISDYFLSSQRLFDLLLINQIDSVIQFRLMFKLDALPLTKQLTSLCGNLWSGSLRSSRSERVEYLLVHEFSNSNFIAPENFTRAEIEKRTKLEQRLGISADDDDDDDEHKPQSKASKRKPQYSGGRVLEPKRGFYDHWIAILDFNSLYPSIIREYNLCFSTTDHWVRRSVDDLEQMVPASNVDTGILPKVVQRLIERRKTVKQLLKGAKDEKEKVSLNIRQLALKLVANSMYGCLGFPSSRFYCQPIAALITFKGRNALENAVQIATSQGANIVYGDTDSIMLSTNTEDYKDARVMAARVKGAINKQYKVLTIDEDAYVKSMLLLRKKKYAALKLDGIEEYNEAREAEFERRKLDNRIVRRQEVINGKTAVYKFKREAKGLDLVRRDWSVISRNTSVRILDSILAAKPRDETVSDIRNYLTNLAKRMDNNQVDISEYVLTKSLTKSLDQYNDAKGLPHVLVAKKMVRAGKFVRAGDVIEYVIVKNPPGAEHGVSISQADRAMAKQEFIELSQAHMSDNSKYCPQIDLEFYKETQILNPIMRLCEVFEEITKMSLAESLGIDASKYRYQQQAQENKDDDTESAMLQNYELYKECEPLYIRCPQCSVGYPFVGLFNYVPFQSVTDASKLQTSNDRFQALCAGNVANKLHDAAYLIKLTTAVSKSGFVCPSPSCSGAIDEGDADSNTRLIYEINNIITCKVRELLRSYYQHSNTFYLDEHTTVKSTELTIKGRLPNPREISAHTQKLCTQLRYYLSLFDHGESLKCLVDEYDLRSKKYGSSAFHEKLTNHREEVTLLEWNSTTVPLSPLTLKLSDETMRVAEAVKEHLDEILSHNAYFNINLKDLFDNLFL